MGAGLEARFAAAARHSRMVRVLRVAVPAAVLLAMAGIVAVSVFNPFRMLLPKLPIDIGNLVVSGTKITMESPHLAGFSTDQRPYEVWAKAAIQDLTDPDHVELKTLRAKVMMEDKSTVTMDAHTGYFDSKQQMLDLRKDIFLQSSTGYEAKLSQAYVDINKGSVTSDEHVDVKLLNGTLTADKLRIINSGEVVRFEGNVVMNLIMESPPAPEPEPEPPPPPQDAVRLRQVRQHEMIFMMQFFSRSFAAAVICARADCRRRRTCAGRHVGRAECDAGLFAKPRPADSDRGGLARNARQEKGSDLRRQREGRAGRHHHDLENAGGVLRFRPGAGHAAAGRAKGIEIRHRCSPRRPGPAAVRRSAGWKPGAPSWSRRRIRS